VRCQIGNETLVLETGRMAKQAGGAVFATYGGSAVLATACCSEKVTEGLDFVPLTVEYNEKYYAAGKIPGGFIKRESRPKDKEILVSRIIDRPMRPLFDKAFGREIQVVPTCLSTDNVNPPDIVAVNAASAAVHISDIPFAGPIAAVRVALVGDTYIVNPTFEQCESAKLEITVSGTAAGITMVEGGSHEVSEEEMIAAIECAKAPIAQICAAIVELRTLAGKEKLPLAPLKVSLNKEEEIRAFAAPLLSAALFVKVKQERYLAVRTAIKETQVAFAEVLDTEVQQKLFSALMEDLQYHILRNGILDKGLRVDGRGLEDVRPITCEINVLPRTHGSALFTRGETQALAVTTLGTIPTSRSWTTSKVTDEIASCSITTFPPSRWEKPGVSAREGAKSDMAVSLAAPWKSCCRPKINFPTPSASYPRFWNPTVLPQWRPFAVLLSP